jgi:enoyl-CoA hydratase
MASRSTPTDRWKTLDFGPPSNDEDDSESVLIDYIGDGAIAVITLNRPHADNAITTEMGARLTDVLETIAVRPAVRVAIITGSGDRAFSVGSDLRQRKSMTKEDWLRQRQDFDRSLYTLREMRTPIFAAVNGIAYGGGSEIAQSTDFIIASDNATFGQPEAMLGLAAGGGEALLGFAGHDTFRLVAADVRDEARLQSHGLAEVVHPLRRPPLLVHGIAEQVVCGVRPFEREGIPSFHHDHVLAIQRSGRGDRLLELRKVPLRPFLVIADADEIVAFNPGLRRCVEPGQNILRLRDMKHDPGHLRARAASLLNGLDARVQ